MPQEHPSDAPDTPPEEDTGQVRITLAIGKDTLERLDAIVRRAGFGGRGRALDSLLEALEEIVSYTRQFNDNFAKVDASGEWTDADARAFRAALMAAALGFAKIDRFYGLKATGLMRGPPGVDIH